MKLAVAEPIESSRVRETASKEISTPTILCIDDDPAIPHGLEMRLRDYDVRVKSAYFGMQGFWEAMTDRPDLVIVDLAMPNGDGQYVISLLRNNDSTRSTPVVVLTGMRDAKLRKKVLADGANQFLTKPVAFDSLLHEISRYIDLRRL